MADTADPEPQDFELALVPGAHVPTFYGTRTSTHQTFDTSDGAGAREDVTLSPIREASACADFQPAFGAAQSAQSILISRRDSCSTGA